MAKEQEQHPLNPTGQMEEPSTVKPDDVDDLSQQSASSAIPTADQQSGPYGPKRGNKAVRGYKGISFKHEELGDETVKAKPTDAQPTGA